MCGAIEGGVSLSGVDLAAEAVVQGRVLRHEPTGEGEPVGNAYVRLLDATGEFTAEVPTSESGQFRFFAGDGTWTLRVLAPRTEPVDRTIVAQRGNIADVAITLVATG